MVSGPSSSCHSGAATSVQEPSAPPQAKSIDLAQQWTALKAKKWTQGRELTAYVQDLALRCGKRSRVATSGGSYKKFVCSSTRECPWLINAVYSRPRKALAPANTTTTEVEPEVEPKVERFWYVTSGSLAHGPACDSVARPTARQLKQNATLRAAVAQKGHSINSLVAQLEATEALQCSKSIVYKAKSDLLDAMEDARRNGIAEPDVVESLQKLPGYLKQLQGMNAHVASVIDTESVAETSADGETVSEKRFVRALLALDPTGVWNDQSVLGVHSVEMQHSSYNGTLLILIGRDGDLKPLMHAVALVPEGSVEHCVWFLEKLIAHGFPLRRFPMVINGRGALSAACSQVHVPHVMMCTRHLLEDMREGKHIELQPEDETLVWQAQRAEAESEHLAAVAQLSRQNEEAAKYIRALEPTRWCLYPYLAMRKMYGWQTTRYEELDLGTQSLGLTLATTQLPYECLKSMSLVAMQAMFQRHERATKWESEGRVVTPAAEKLMQEQAARVPQYSVCMSSTQLAFVWNSHNTQIRQRRVDLQHRTCTCARRLQWGIPCRHVLAVLQKMGALNQAVEFFDECYLVRNYVSSFKGRALELPVEDSIARDPNMHPPILVEKQQSNGGTNDADAGKNKRKRRVRVRPPHERKRAMYKCHKCQRAEGHNKGTCPY